MKTRLSLFLVVMMFAIGSIAFAGKPKMAKAVVASYEHATFEQSAARAFAVNSFKHPTKVADYTFNVGTSWYNYMWNSGGPRHVDYYNGITHLIWITRSPESPSGTIDIVYSSFDGVTWLAPQVVEPPATQGTSFSGISVWRGGAANGFAVFRTAARQRKMPMTICRPRLKRIPGTATPKISGEPFQSRMEDSASKSLT